MGCLHGVLEGLVTPRVVEVQVLFPALLNLLRHKGLGNRILEPFLLAPVPPDAAGFAVVLAVAVSSLG